MPENKNSRALEKSPEDVGIRLHRRAAFLVFTYAKVFRLLSHISFGIALLGTKKVLRHFVSIVFFFSKPTMKIIAILSKFIAYKTILINGSSV